MTKKVWRQKLIQISDIFPHEAKLLRVKSKNKKTKNGKIPTKKEPIRTPILINRRILAYGIVYILVQMVR